MLSSLTVKPLLIAVCVLTLLLSASATLNVRSWKQLGAARAECTVEKLGESNVRSDVTRNLEAESLRSKIEALETELVSLRAISKAVELRHTQSQSLLDDYRKQLDAARKADPHLDHPVDTTRLRNLETAYRVRAEGDHRNSVQGRATEPAAPSLQGAVTQ